MADPKLVVEVLAQPDYTLLAATVEKKQSFTPPNIHASGHFGVGGILGTMGNAAESPGGASNFLPFEMDLHADMKQTQSSISTTEISTTFSGNGNRRT